MISLIKVGCPNPDFPILSDFLTGRNNIITKNNQDVKEEEVVNRITKMAAGLHFSGDRSSISGMKVPVEVTNWSWRTWMISKRS